MLKNRSFIVTLCIVLTECLPTQVDASDYQSPRTAALGGAGHAGPMLNDAIYLNPSFVSLLPSYSVSANYLFYRGPSDTPDTGDPHGHNLNASIQDGRSELFQAGVGVTLMEDRKTISMGASKAIVQRFGVGLGGKVVIPNVPSPHPIWDSLLSVSGVPLQWLQLSGVVDNLVQAEEGIPYGLYREFIIGSKVNLQGIILIYFDPHWAPSAENIFGHELGLEFPFFQDFFLRVGNFRNANVPWLNTRGGGYALGMGWIAPRSSYDFAFHRTTDPVIATTMELGMTVYF
ncbi:hypothetical protein WDW37_03270 [Bdellovibrionota bacterium FG-1]